MTLTLDGTVCEMNSGPHTLPGFNADDLSNVERGREGYSLKLQLPATPHNDRLLAFARDPHTAGRFNATRHTAELSEQDSLLFVGTARLLKASEEGYTLEIRGGGSRWAKNAVRTMFNRIPINYSARLTAMEIFASWTNDSPIKFFPIHRDEYAQKNSSTDLLPSERLLSVDDYHPFLNIGALMRAIFTQAGYRLESRFMDSDYFRSLYISGAYPSRNTDAVRCKMDFLARRLTDVIATADNVGRVYATPYGAGNIVGNIVETATPQSVTEDGEVLTDLFNNGGCFGMSDRQIIFRPPTEVSVGFEYYLHYTTDHRILTRERLKGFDSVYLGTGDDMPFMLANRYPDRRDSLNAGHDYRAIVFGHTAGAQYRLTFTKNGVSGTLWADFAARTAAVTTPFTGIYTNPVLLIKSGNNWNSYGGDWALYDGYIGERGETTVELRVQTAPEIATPTSPKKFNTIFFHGAEPGMKFTLHKTCTLRPKFSSHPGYGEVVTFADLAQHPVRQSVFLDAVRHLFNLRFYTEERTRTLRIEPADDFYDRSTIFDWSKKTDFSMPIEMRDIALDIHENRTWSYLDEDGAVKRLNTELDTPFGEWRVETDSCAALQGEQKLTSPMFCPTLNAAGYYTNAPSALIMQVGDRDLATANDDTRFTPRIVRYCGLHPLPASERWGYPSGKSEYPLAAFHFAGSAATTGFTLCFEDRDGLQGLHRFYDRQTTQESCRQYITLSLRLESHDIESLFTPGDGAPHIGSIFRLDVGGETLLATLHTITAYDPYQASTRCIFTRLTED